MCGCPCDGVIKKVAFCNGLMHLWMYRCMLFILHAEWPLECSAGGTLPQQHICNWSNNCKSSCFPGAVLANNQQITQRLKETLSEEGSCRISIVELKYTHNSFSVYFWSGLFLFKLKLWKWALPFLLLSKFMAMNVADVWLKCTLCRWPAFCVLCC